MTMRCDMIAVFVVRPDETGTSHEFLQLRRSPQKYLAGLWTTIYGTAEGAETAVQAALRELREESSLTPREFYRLGIAPSFYCDADDTIYVVPSFCAIVNRPDPITLNDEHDGYRWVMREDAINAFFWQTEKQSIEALCKDVLDNSPAKPYLRVQ